MSEVSLEGSVPWRGGAWPARRGQLWSGAEPTGTLGASEVRGDAGICVEVTSNGGVVRRCRPGDPSREVVWRREGSVADAPGSSAS